ncbi:MAG: Asp-tRNA(Asn)/Glu-tRNA(Gln) amidotransferase subunit GatB [Elusimicrobia bacterium]|nr:Asp-tRNA(Asn)/Glu-tRNA(Gln) amidotransferase subunit GatB [Elusimicrobiota bacterium]
MSPDYIVTIGLEVHVHLDTKTKLFCSCPNITGGEPNTRICPVCTGQPGALPVFNERVLFQAVLAALAINCRINHRSIFARKQYFYPDMPTNYQITQHELPIAEKGHLGGTGINRLHIEEDAGKLIHTGGSSLVDLNRASAPLIEIVTEPEITSPQEAGDFLRNLRQILRYAGVSDCDMEKGSMRCDANISLRKNQDDPLGVKSELKNLNSFRSVEMALDYEILRQSEILSSGGEVIQETRLWDEDSLRTKGMRTKEESDDYRFFSDPDLPPLLVGEDFVEEVATYLPEMPDARKNRFVTEFGLSEYDAGVLTQEKDTADYFEEALKVCGLKQSKMLASWLSVEVAGQLNALGVSMSDNPVKPAHLGSLVREISQGNVSGTMAKDIFAEMFETGFSPENIIEKKGLKQINSEDEINAFCEKVLKDNPDLVEKYLDGKHGVLGAMVGQVMKESRGQANPKKVNETLRRLIEKFQ